MKILYIANIRLPTEKAHGIQIMKTCEALAHLGHTVELLVPRRFNRIKEDPFSYYGVKPNFSIHRTFCLDLTRFGKLGFVIELLSFSEFVFWKVFFTKADVYYGRDTLPLLYLSLWKKNIFWEVHKGEISFVAELLLKRALKIITISKGIKDFFVSKGVPSSKISVVPDAVDISLFHIETSREEARRVLNLPQDKKIVTYSGSLSLYEWKGVDTFLKASKVLPEVYFLVVGGNQKEVDKLQKEDSRNVHFVKQVSHEIVPLYLKASDVLVLPNKKGNEISERFTSPMKLFEYMASGTPMVVSDLPSIREVVSEKEAFFFGPDNPQDLAKTTQEVLSNEEEAKKRGAEAKEKVKEYSWEKRAEKIISLIKN